MDGEGMQQLGHLVHITSWDNLPTHLTVQEFLTLTARQCYPAASDACRRVRAVADVVASFGLHHVSACLIGTLPASEQKFAVLAAAVLEAPSLLLLERPLDGLSASSAVAALDSLRLVARRLSIAIVCLGPVSGAVFESFDNTVLVAVDGRTAFSGSPPLVRSQPPILILTLKSSLKVKERLRIPSRLPGRYSGAIQQHSDSKTCML